MKEEFPEGFFTKKRPEATEENYEFDPKTCVPINWNEDVIFNPHWIPCSEREPDKDGDYLVTEVMRNPFDGEETGELMVDVEAYYTTDSDDGYGWWTYAGWQGGLRVVAWAECPKPYIEES